MTEWKRDGGFGSWDEAVARVRKLEETVARLWLVLRLVLCFAAGCAVGTAGVGIYRAIFG